MNPWTFYWRPNVTKLSLRSAYKIWSPYSSYGLVVISLEDDQRLLRRRRISTFHCTVCCFCAAFSSFQLALRYFNSTGTIRHCRTYQFEPKWTTLECFCRRHASGHPRPSRSNRYRSHKPRNRKTKPRSSGSPNHWCGIGVSSDIFELTWMFTSIWSLVQMPSGLSV